MQHEVKLDVFSGPIDLLLHLITRQRVDIYDVSLSTITDEYLQAITGFERVDLERATGFLVVAATLLELKSARLLPGPGDAELDEHLLEERDLLLARLVECSTFREAGMWLSVQLERGALRHPRPPGTEPRYTELAPDVTLKLSLRDLLRGAERVFAPRPEPTPLSTEHIHSITASVRDAIAEMTSLLVSGRAVNFEELCGEEEERIEIVVRFLGLLEMFKAGAIDLEQRDRFGSITATWTGEVETDEVLAGVEEYAATTTEGP